MAKRWASKRPGKKMGVAKAKKMVTKAHKRAAKKNMDTYFLKTKDTVTVTPVQGLSVSNYIYRAYTLDAVMGQANGTGLYLSNAEFNLWKLQYDKFRVNSVKVTVTPKSNVLDQRNAQEDNTENVTGDGLIHTCIDRDGLAPSSKAIVSRYPSYRKYSVLKPFSRTYSVKYPTGVWLDCEAPANFSMNKELGLSGGVTLYAENILEDNYEVFNEPWATITIEYNIVFQGKTSNSLSGVYDEGGELIGVTINKIQPESLLALTPHVNVTGSLSKDTRTTDEITEVPINDLGIPV